MILMISIKLLIKCGKSACITCAFLLLTACATTAPNKPTNDLEASKSINANQQSTVTSNSKNMPKRTLESLILAEIAGQRGHYSYALNEYLTQAQTTQNTVIAARAFDIAQFIDDSQAQDQALHIWLANDETSSQALLKAAEFSMRRGKLIAAFEYMQKLETLKARAPYHYLALFAEELSTSKKQELLKKIQAQNSNNEDNQINLLYAQGLLLQQLEKYKRALNYYEKALKKAPYRKDIGLQKARLLLAQNKPQKSLNWIETLRQQHPHQKSIDVLRARLLIRTNRQEAALDAFSELHQSYPFDADIVLALALLELDMLQLQSAQQHLEILLYRQQKQNPANYYLGRLAQTNKLYTKALKHFKAVTQGREYIAAQANIVSILYSQKGIKPALAHLHSLKNNPPKIQAGLWLLEAETLIQEKQLDQAMQVYNKALKASPQHIELLYSRAIVAIEQNNLILAERDLAEIIQLNPLSHRALNTLGYTLLINTPRLKDAENLITQAYKLNPSSPAILDSLGWLYFKMGDLEEAKSILEEAFAKSQDHEIAAHLGEVLWLKGQQDAALEVWQRGLESNPKSLSIKHTMERLNAAKN